MSINIQSWRLYGILHYDPSLTCYLWSLIPTFFEAPQVGETRCPPPSRIEAPRHGNLWRPPRRLCSATAPQPRRGRRAPPSAAASNLRRFSPGSRRPLWASGEDDGAQRPMRRGGRRKWWECWALYSFNRQRKDECFGLHIFKTVHIHKHIGQVSMHLFYNITFDE